MQRYQQRIEAAFLAHCSPQVAYDWLFDRRYTGDEESPWLSETSEVEFLEYLLVRRKVPLIDLGIARFGHCLPMIRKVFRRGNSGARCGALANPHVGPIPRINRVNHGWLEGEEFENLIRHGSDAELEALVTNRFLTDDALECLLERKEEFGDLSDEKYTKMLIWLGKNPRMSTEYDDRILDGWARYAHGRVFSLAWDLARYLDTTQTNAYVLYELLKNTAIPIRYDNPMEVLERWRIDEEPQDRHRSLAGLLRTRLADVVKADDHLLASNDPAVRESFYRRFAPWQFKDWPTFIERDGELAFEGMLENDELWRSTESRRMLRDLAWEIPDPYSSMKAPNYYTAVEERKRQQYPEWFAEEESEYSNTPDAIARRIQKKVDKVVHIVEALPEDHRTMCEAREVADKVEQLLERSEDTGTYSRDELAQEFHRLREELREAGSITQPISCRYERAPIWPWIIVIPILILILLK